MNGETLKKDQELREHEKKAEQANSEARAQYVESMRTAAEEMYWLLQHEKLKGFKFMLETMLAEDMVERESLLRTVKSSEEYVRRGIAIDARIQRTRYILSAPADIIARYESIREPEKPKEQPPKSEEVQPPKVEGVREGTDNA